MHPLLPQNIALALDEISAARLSSYSTFFTPLSDEALYGLYCWNDVVSSRLMRLIGIVEVILRNRFHSALSRHFWTPGHSYGTTDSNDWYTFMIPSSSYGGDKIKKVTHRKLSAGNWVQIVPRVSANKVVASMTYGFWPRLLDFQNTISGVAVPWANLIPQIVPSHHERRPRSWASLHQQDKLFARIDFVGDLRNRVAHFEPVWKFGDLKSETRARPNRPVTVVALAPATPAEAIARLNLSYTRTTQLLRWLSQERAAEYMDSENNHTLTWLLSEEALDRYKNLKRDNVVRLSTLTKSWGLKMALRGQKAVTVTHKGNVVGRYYAK